MPRFIQPVELKTEDRRLVSRVKKQAKRLTKTPMTAAEVIRRAIRFAGPKFLSGEAPLVDAIPEVRIKPGK